MWLERAFLVLVFSSRTPIPNSEFLVRVPPTPNSEPQNFRVREQIHVLE